MRGRFAFGPVGSLALWWVGIGLALSASGCVSSPGALPPCDSWSDEQAICGLSNPEDLALYPHDGWVIVSEMHPASDATAAADATAGETAPPFMPGRITALRPAPRGKGIERRRLFPLEWVEALPGAERWGDPDCAGPPSIADFLPHGLDLGVGPGGRAALAVVVHGAREVIDLFEMLPEDAPTLEWRGCVEVPESMSANDVALVGDGGFVMTNMLPRFASLDAKAIWNGLKISLGFTTGSVLRWSPDTSWVELEGSRGSAPNGIAISRDGRSLYVSEWGGEAVYRLRYAKVPTAGAIPVRQEVAVEGSPDNLTWTPGGRLLVASQLAGPVEAIRCAEVAFGGCDLGYVITSIDPRTLAATRIAEGRGAASVALEVGDEIWVGSFVGDSIERLPRKD